MKYVIIAGFASVVSTWCLVGWWFMMTGLIYMLMWEGWQLEDGVEIIPKSKISLQPRNTEI